MIIRSTQKVWIVTDARPTSTIADVMSETTLNDMANMARGGLEPARENLCLYTERTAALADALDRLARKRERGDTNA